MSYVDEGPRGDEAVLMLHGNPTWSFSTGISSASFRLNPLHRAGPRGHGPLGQAARLRLRPCVADCGHRVTCNDIDGVMIATGDFQHAKLCAEVVRAGKDCYVEKPFANVLAEAKETRDVVKQSRQIVQMGTQHRSQPYPLAVRDIMRSGRIGDIVHIEQEWNVNQERWRFTPMDTGIPPESRTGAGADWKQWLHDRASKLREEDTDWKRWLLGKPYRPFDPHVYLEFRLYKDYSAGILTSG